MHSSAGDISALLDADLGRNGWSELATPTTEADARIFAMGALRRSLFKVS